MVQTRQEKTRRAAGKLIALALVLLQFACTEQAPTKLDVNETSPVNRWSTDQAWGVLQAQDKRDIPKLCAFLNDTTWQVRRAAALAFASVRSGEAVDCLRKGLNDESDAVRAAAAFAMGLCGNADEAEELVDMLQFEHHSTVRYALWEATGRIGDELTLRRLLYQQTKNANDSLGLAWALFATALNGHLNDTAVSKCFDLLLTPDLGTRLGAAHALGRGSAKQLAQHQRALASWLKSEPLSEVRMALWRAFGKNASQGDLALIESSFAKAKTLEKVSILRATRNLKSSGAKQLLISGAMDPNAQVAVTAVDLLVDRPDFSAATSKQLKGKVSDPEAAMNLEISAQRRFTQAKSLEPQQLEAILGENPSPILLARAHAAQIELSANSPLHQLVKMAMDQESSAMEKTAATQALFGWINRQNEHTQKEWLALSKLLNSKDPGVLADVAIHIMDRDDLKGNDPAKFALFAEYSAGQLNLPRDLEAKLMLEMAIAHLKGEEDPEHVAPPYNHSISRTDLDKLPNGQAYLIKTNKGNITMITLVDETPSTALAFDSLVTAGYYNGKSFHRVVPNFVAQGGCPRGDGYGSLDWTLRTEIGLSRYITGSVGMASAGADTESCQFFITHSPTPHLDGGYTRFGQVVEGMDIVNQLQLGDVIESIERSHEPVQ